MRNPLWLLLLTGCGTSDPLTWEKCPGCAADSATLWNVIADGAEIGGDYDVVGPPDPYMCLTVGGTTKCSSESSDTSTPRWNYTIYRSQPAPALIGKSLTVNIWDVDTGGLDTNDAVCSTTLQISAEDLEAGGIMFSCKSSSAAFRFHALR